MKKTLIHKYQNGNYYVKLYSDGTKEKFTKDDFFHAQFPDSIDLKITNYCDANCPMCHENSSVSGKHANLDAPFLNTLRKGTELAIGGGNPLSHPYLIPFLQKMKKMGVVCNVTVNEMHLLSNYELIEQLINENLVNGVGVSIIQAKPKTVEFLLIHSNAVAHVIAGVVSQRTLMELSGCKLLILGYKLKGRGKSYYTSQVIRKILLMRELMSVLLRNYECLSFDNLALKQLNVKNYLSEDEFNKRFMGKDGESSMYIDLVQEHYAISSVSKDTYPIQEDIIQMFKHVQNLI